MGAPLNLAHVIGPMYLILGLSILLYVKPWQKLIEKFEDDHLSLFTLKLMYGVLGLIVVNMYNVWEWNVWLLVTLTGWGMVVKSIFYFLMPGSLIKKMLAMKKKQEMLYVGSLVLLVFGAALTYYSYLV